MKVGAYYYGLRHCITSQPEGNIAVWIIVNRLMKSAYFIPFRLRQYTKLLAEKYMHEVVWLHGVPVNIVLDKDNIFMSNAPIL